MLIGLTYDLKQEYLDAGYSAEDAAEFDCIETIDAIDAILRDMGHETDRIGRITTLVERLSRGDRWDMVYNIAEGLHGVGREAQVPAILDAYEIPYTYSDPLVSALSLHKGMCKRVIRDLGLPTSEFVVVENPSQIAKCLKLQMPLFAKPVAEGTSKGISGKSKITTERELFEICTRLLKQFKQPVLVEEFLPGRELTVGIVGTGDEAQVIGAMEVLLLSGAEQGAYSYQNKMDWIGKITYNLAKGDIAEEAAQLALGAWRGLGCRDGGRVDVRADRYGRLNFIEVNPLPGIHPEISDLTILGGLAGWPYKRIITAIVNSALKRVKTASPTMAM